MREIIEHIKAIAESKTRLVKFELVDNGAKLTSNFVFTLILVFGLFLITVLLAIVLLIGTATIFNSYLIGSVITFFTFTVALSICYFLLGNKIKQSITNKVYQEVLDENIDSSQKFEAIKKIEDLKVKYHEGQTLNKIDVMLADIHSATLTANALASLLKAKNENDSI